MANKRVVVIGAGIAGITASVKLLKKGVDVILLEASNRVGGRVKRAQEFDFPVDLGASWIHRKDGNPF